jgi:hypothetical protein
MTIAENFIGGAITVISVFSYGHLSDFFKSDFLFDIHFSVVICDFVVKSSQITIVLMHVSFIIHYKNNLLDKKDSYLIPRPPSWDDRNYSYGHQLYPSEYIYLKNILSVPSGGGTGLSMLSFSGKKLKSIKE